MTRMTRRHKTSGLFNKIARTIPSVLSALGYDFDLSRIPSDPKSRAALGLAAILMFADKEFNYTPKGWGHSESHPSIISKLLVPCASVLYIYANSRIHHNSQPNIGRELPNLPSISNS